MSGYRDIARAYQSAGNLRSQRERDAEVFEVFAARLRNAESEGSIAIAKALADNARLWQTVITITLDSDNPQPLPVRRSLLALASSVQQQMNGGSPDIVSLIRINENVAAGLRGVAVSGGAVRGITGG